MFSTVKEEVKVVDRTEEGINNLNPTSERTFCAKESRVIMSNATK